MGGILMNYKVYTSLTFIGPCLARDAYAISKQ